MSKPENYGSRYWRINLADGEDLYICADEITVSHSGALTAWGGYRKENEDGPHEKIIVYAFAPGLWDSFCAASHLTQGAVCAY